MLGWTGVTKTEQAGVSGLGRFWGLATWKLTQRGRGQIGTGETQPAGRIGPLAEIQEFGQSLRSQIHISLTIVSPARNTDRLGFVFLGNDH